MNDDDDDDNDLNLGALVMLGLSMCPELVIPCIVLVVLVTPLLITGVVWFAVHVLPYVLMSVSMMTIVSGPVAAITWALRRI